MPVTKYTWTKIFDALELIAPLDLIGSSEGGSTYYSPETETVLWEADGQHHIETKSEFEGSLPE